MYPPIILVTFLVITSSSINAFENAVHSFQTDGGSDEDRTFEYDSSESNATTPNYLNDDYNASSSSVSAETETSDTQSSENIHKASVAEAFVGHIPTGTYLENPHNQRQNRKEDDDNFEEHSGKDPLQILYSNYLYGPSNNDTYFLENPEKESSSSEEPSFEIIEELEFTTLHPTIIATPETIRPTTKTMITGTEYLSRLITDQNLRTPIAFLIDTSIDSLQKTQTQLEFSLRPRSPLDAILIHYNSSAVSEALTFTNTKTLMNVVNTIVPSYDDKGKLYYGIIKACQEVPYDSAIFLATAHDTDSKELFNKASKMLSVKRIRLYVMWFGEPLDPLKPTHHVQALSIQTGGYVICFDDDNEKTLVAVEEQRGSHSYHFSIDDNVISMFFKLQGNLDKSTLETPNGD